MAEQEKEPKWDRSKPFEPGNVIAVQHGVNSQRMVSPVAEAIKREILSDPALPDYLHQAQFRHALDAYCWAEAQCARLREHLARLELETALTDRTETDETEDRDGGSVRRRSVSRRMESAQEIARKYESLASNLRSRLGLDPASAAKLGRNLAAAKLDVAQAMAQLDREESGANGNA